MHQKKFGWSLDQIVRRKRECRYLDMKGPDSTIQTHLLDNIYNQYKIEKGSLYCADFQQLNEDSLNSTHNSTLTKDMPQEESV